MRYWDIQYKLLHTLHNTKYYTGYKGCSLVFVEQFETALAEYNKVVEIQTDIINDELAMHLFSTKFKVIDDTELIYEQAKDNSTMFDELLNLLRTKLAERDYLRGTDFTRNTTNDKRGYKVTQDGMQNTYSMANNVPYMINQT